MQYPPAPVAPSHSCDSATFELIQLSCELKARGWPSLHGELMLYDNRMRWAHLDTLCFRDLKSMLSVFGSLWHSRSRIGVYVSFAFVWRT